MRVIGEIQHADCKITLFQWNNRYLIKLEKGLLEQTFKINQFDLASENDLHSVVTDEFIQTAMARFDMMEHSLGQAMSRLTY
jgi:hypothetical protein